MNRFMVLVTILLLPSALAVAQTEDPMKGLPGVEVVLEGLGNGEEVNGVPFKGNIQTDIELALRSAGIKVLNRQERLAHPAGPILYVELIGVEDNGLAGYAWIVELRQTVTLWNGEISSRSATTWSRTMIGVVGRSNVWQVRENLKDYVSQFANDWLIANPR